jgi:hypothetical protein
VKTALVLKDNTYVQDIINATVTTWSEAMKVMRGCFESLEEQGFGCAAIGHGKVMGQVATLHVVSMKNEKNTYKHT